MFRETNRPVTNPIPNRMSRHYYDVYCLSKYPLLKQLLKSKYLLKNIVKSDILFYYRSWAKMNGLLNDKIRIIPSKDSIDKLSIDYKKMNSMFFDKHPTFEQIIIELSKLEKEINFISQ